MKKEDSFRYWFWNILYVAIIYTLYVPYKFQWIFYILNISKSNIYCFVLQLSTSELTKRAISNLKTRKFHPDMYISDKPPRVQTPVSDVYSTSSGFEGCAICLEEYHDGQVSLAYGCWKYSGPSLIWTSVLQNIYVSGQLSGTNSNS